MSKRQSQAIRKSIRLGRPRGTQTRAIQRKATALVALVVAVVKRRQEPMTWREPL